MKMHEMLEFWTADEIYNCLPLPGISGRRLGRKLMNITNLAENATPMGGDGSDGTVEEPSGRLGDFDDQAPAFWDRLTESEQLMINMAYTKEHG